MIEGVVFSLDDAPSDRMAIKRAIEKIAPSVELHMFATGTALLARLAELRDHELPDLILMDLNLAQENGTDVLRTVRTAHPTVPVAMLSGSARPADLTLAYELGAGGVLVKPLGIQALADVIEPALRYWCMAVTRP